MQDRGLKNNIPCKNISQRGQKQNRALFQRTHHAGQRERERAQAWRKEPHYPPVVSPTITWALLGRTE